uniref:Turripeptide OL22 n=1 Tax=Iotyrris olangoensis TaxID=2420066 RepID=TU22_IOTOL|nr:RecName: Full=Turripeptide OL22; AltName: Full=Turripeptide OL78 [Iotyrris olangoensis]
TSCETHQICGRKIIYRDGTTNTQEIDYCRCSGDTDCPKDDVNEISFVDWSYWEVSYYTCLTQAGNYHYCNEGAAVQPGAGPIIYRQNNVEHPYKMNCRCNPCWINKARCCTPGT